MDEPRPACCVGVDVSKDRLDVHLLPSREAFAVARDGKGLENLVERRECQEFRVWAGMMEKKEILHGPTQRAPHP